MDKKYIISTLIIIFLMGLTAYAASTSRIERTILPEADSTYDLGSNANRWANIYGDTIYGDGSNLTGVTAGSDTWEINASGQLTPTTTINVLLPGNATTTGTSNLATTTVSGDFTVNNQTSTSTINIYSEAADFGGSIIKEKEDGSGCTEQWSGSDGLEYFSNVSCP